MVARSVLVIAATLLLAGCAAPSAPAPQWAPAAEPPPRIGTWEGVVTDLVDPAWVQRVAAATGIPERALAAYAGAALLTEEVNPGCGIAWNTLAALGAVESDHGRHDGSALDADGTAQPGIFGIALDGGDTDEITDTDGGEIDGDAVHDRAVGPMQMIPESWRNWGFDGNNDGVRDAQNIDDASVAAANYLCRASRDTAPMSTLEGWRAGIVAYNSAPSYIDAVATAAVAAGEAAVEGD